MVLVQVSFGGEIYKDAALQSYSKILPLKLKGSQDQGEYFE